MSTDSKIEWCDHTFNPWWGCTKISPGCDNCYAEKLACRFGTLLGAGQRRREFGEKHWQEPLRWNAKAAREGKRARVFCASMADVFDLEAPTGAHNWLWTRIRQTPNLDWLLLTKRIGNAKAMLPEDWSNGYSNVWLGATIVNQEEADRDIPKLLRTPARVRFLSIEPMLGRISLRAILPGQMGKVDWIIIGGESGSGARSMMLDWSRDLVRACKLAGVPVFIKQLGARPMKWEGQPYAISDSKGAIMDEWPAELRVREFP